MWNVGTMTIRAESCWRCSCQEKENDEDQKGVSDIVKEDLKEVGAREDEVFDRSVGRIPYGYPTPDGKAEIRRVSHQNTHQYILMLLLKTNNACRPILDESLRSTHTVIHLVNASTVRRLCGGHVQWTRHHAP